MEPRSGPDTGEHYDRPALLQEIIAALGLIQASIKWDDDQPDWQHDEFTALYDGFVEDTSKRALISIVLTMFANIPAPIAARMLQGMMNYFNSLDPDEVDDGS